MNYQRAWTNKDGWTFEVAVKETNDLLFGKSSEWHCEYCDALNKLDRVICVECGAPIPRRKRAGRVCDYCGLPKMTPGKSCQFCGSSSFSVKMQEVAWWHLDRPPCEFSIEYRLPCNDVRFNFYSMAWEQFFED